MSIKTCNGCRAYKQLTSGNPNGWATFVYGNVCELGFELEELPANKINTDLDRRVTYKHKPKCGDCPKPKTVSKYVECLIKK